MEAVGRGSEALVTRRQFDLTLHSLEAHFNLGVTVATLPLN